MKKIFLLLLLLPFIGLPQFNPIFFAGSSSFSSFNMVSYYQLESSAIDSKSSINGTESSITYGAGKVSNAAVFNGTNSQIYAQNAAFDFFGTQRYSFSFVIYLDNLPSSGKAFYPLMTQEGGSTGTFDKGFRIFSNGSIDFYAFDGSPKSALSSSGIISPLTWYVITGVFNGSALKLYVNETLVGSISCSGSFNFTNPRIVMSFFNASTNDEYLKGKLDEVTIFKKALNNQDIHYMVTKYNANQHLF